MLLKLFVASNILIAASLQRPKKCCIGIKKVFGLESIYCGHNAVNLGNNPLTQTVPDCPGSQKYFAAILHCFDLQPREEK